ncbi:MAG: GIY-YIG nuclease family protein, partial [Phycisphaerae bacterium]
MAKERHGGTKARRHEGKERDEGTKGRRHGGTKGRKGTKGRSGIRNPQSPIPNPQSSIINRQSSSLRAFVPSCLPQTIPNSLHRPPVQSALCVDTIVLNMDDDPRITPLRQKIARFPKSPGVYFMKDAQGRVLYIGKAKDLRSRVGSYFQPSADLLNTRG